jgi:hypothetical protein
MVVLPLAELKSLLKLVELAGWLTREIVEVPGGLKGKGKETVSNNPLLPFTFHLCPKTTCTKRAS